jgi:hypothetical protein
MIFSRDKAPIEAEALAAPWLLNITLALCSYPDRTFPVKSPRGSRLPVTTTAPAANEKILLSL